MENRYVFYINDRVMRNITAIFRYENYRDCDLFDTIYFWASFAR